MPGESSSSQQNLSHKARFERDFPDFVYYSDKIKIPHDSEGSIDYDTLHKATGYYLYNNIDEDLIQLFKIVRAGDFENDESFYKKIYDNLSKKDQYEKLFHLLYIYHHQSLFDYIYKQKKEEIPSDGSDSFGQSQLHWAAVCNQSRDELNQILQDGCKVNQFDTNDSTALHIAAQYGHAEVVKFLIEKGAEVNQTNKVNMTALCLAVRYGHVEVVKDLIQNDEINFEKIVEALYMAARYGHPEVVKVLLEKNVDVNKVNGFGWTPLHYAAGYGHAEVIEVLLEKKAKVNQSDDKKGWTALHWAANNGHFAAFKALLKGNPAIYLTTKNGETELSLALGNRHYNIAYACLGAMYNVTESYGRGEIKDTLKSKSVYYYYPHSSLIRLFLQHKKYDTLQYMLENELNLPPDFDLSLENFNGDSLVDIIEKQYRSYKDWLNKQRSELKSQPVVSSEEDYRRDFPDHEVYQDKISKGKNEDQGSMDYTALYQATEAYLYKDVNKTLVTLLKIIRRGDFSDETLKEQGFTTRLNFYSQVNDYLFDKDKSDTSILMLLQKCHDQALLNYIYKKKGHDVFEKNDLTKPSELQSGVKGKGKGKAKLIQSPPVAMQHQNGDLSVIPPRDKLGFNQFDKLLLLSKNPIDDIQTQFAKLNMATIKQTVDHNQFPALPQGSLLDFNEKNKAIEKVRKEYKKTIRSRRVSGIAEWVDLVHYNDRLDDSHREEAAETIKQLTAIHLCFVTGLEYFAKAEDSQDIQKQWEHFNKNILNSLDKIKNKEDLGKIIDSFINENNQRFTFLTMMKGDSYRSYVQVLQTLKEHYRTVFKKRGEELKALLGDEPTLNDAKGAWNVLSSPQARVNVQDGAGSSSSSVKKVPEEGQKKLKERHDEVFGL